MAVHSGKFGVVNGQSTVYNWTLEDSQEANPFRTSNMLCGTGRTQGVYSWNGSFSQYGGNPSVLPGDSFTFTGYTAPDDDVSGNGQQASGTALVESVAITWDWSSGGIINSAINFQGHLALTWSDATVTDTTDPVVPTACATKVEYENGSTDAEITNLTQAVLTLNNELQSYVNSSTIVSGKCWTGQKAGNVDFEVALTQQCNERDETGAILYAPAIGSNLQLYMYTDATDYWDLQWAHVIGYSGLTVDNDSGSIIERTINLAMNGWDGSNKGTIVKPGGGSGNIYWP